MYEPAALTKAYGYTDFNISAHTTKTCIIGRVGRTRRKKTTNQYDEENRWVFSFDFKDETQSEDECVTEFQITGHMY